MEGESVQRPGGAIGSENQKTIEGGYAGASSRKENQNIEIRSIIELKEIEPMNLAMAKPIEILLIEDSPSDVALTIEALKAGRIGNNLNRVADGVEAMDYLRQKGRFAQSPRPDLIMLDLNLPKKDGREVLRELKNDPSLKFIPIIVLTTSRADKDVLQSYELNANCYITKPVDFQQFIDVIKSIEHFWLSVVTLPRRA
jgi:two-component system, chemotaxis family, response regulator Rcp1